MVEFSVEVGKGGKFQSRGQDIRTFSTRSEAERFARQETMKGDAIAMDRLSGGGQRSLVVAGLKNPEKDPHGNFGRFKTKRSGIGSLFSPSKGLNWRF